MRISIKKIRKILATVVGAAQSVVGVWVVIIACTLYIDFFDLQARLSVTSERAPLYTLVLVLFGFFSIISGLFLLTEREESP